MIRVGLARTEPHYRLLRAPWGPGNSDPEFVALFGSAADDGPFNHVYGAVRSCLRALGLDAARFDTPEWNPLGALVRLGVRQTELSAAVVERYAGAPQAPARGGGAGAAAPAPA